MYAAVFIFAKGELMSKIRLYISALLMAVIILFTACTEDETAETTGEVSEAVQVTETSATTKATSETTTQTTTATTTETTHVTTTEATSVSTSATTAEIITTPETTAAVTTQPVTIPETTTAKPVTTVPTTTAETTSAGPKTYSTNLNIKNVLTVLYTPEAVVPSKYYQDDTVLFINEEYIANLIDQFNNMKFVELSAEQLKKEKTAFEKWQKKNSNMTAVPESLTFFDRNGQVILKIESDLHLALTEKRDSEYFVRMTWGGKTYEYYTGKVKVKEIQTYALNQILIRNNLLSVEICQAVAIFMVNDTTLFVDETPEYRLYAPYEEMTSIDGETLLPEDFGEDVRLCDCTFTYLNGDYYVVTMNAATGEVYAARVVKQ